MLYGFLNFPFFQAGRTDFNSLLSSVNHSMNVLQVR